MNTIIETIDLCKTYTTGQTKVHALSDLNFSITEGAFVSIMGTSGSGKSTLLNIIGCLDVPTTGTYLLKGENPAKLSRDRLADIRNTRIGFVFQSFNLLARRSSLENVELPLLYRRKNPVRNSTSLALRALDRVGLQDRAHHDPNQLSGGQKQRVAVARALVNNPSLILADEPTGNLDTRTSHEIMALFKELNEAGHTILLITHDREIAEYSDRIIELRDGRILSDEVKGSFADDHGQEVNNGSEVESTSPAHSGTLAG